MSRSERMWVDADRCTGCGACIEACPEGAIALVDTKARIDETTCTGCGVCIETCPEGAIQPVIRGELVTAPERPAPAVYRPGPLVETAGAAIAVASAGLLVRVVRALARALGRWLSRRLVAREPFAPITTSGTDRGGRRRRARLRRRRE